MNRAEQMVLGCNHAAVRLLLSPSPMVGRTVTVSPRASACTRYATLVERRGKTRRSPFLRRDMHQIAKSTGRGLLECMAMAGCVFFAALATVLFGL